MTPSGHIVVLNGPPGVGKSTVSAALAALLPGTVAIHGDELRAFAPKDAPVHLGGGSTYRAAAVLARAYLAMGAKRVVFDYVFSRPQHLRYFLEAHTSPAPIYLFTLWAPLAVVQQRDAGRLPERQVGPGVEECVREMVDHLEVFGHLLRNQDVAPEPMARQIHELVAGGVGRMNGVDAGEDR